MVIRYIRKKVDLQTGAVTERTRARYEAAISRFGIFLAFVGLGASFSEFSTSDYAKDPFAVDSLVASYLQMLYDMDFPRHYGRDLLTVLPKRLLNLRRHLTASWGAMNVWERMEPPRRAEPIGLDHVLLLMFHVFSCCSFSFNSNCLDLVSLGVCFGIMFHCMLRPSEAFNIRRCDVVFNLASASITLNHTKTSTRKNAREFVSVEDPFVVLVLRLYCSAFDAAGFSESCCLFDFADSFTELLVTSATSCGLAILGLQPYSFRRGGATFDFEVFRSFDRLCERGRWLHQKNARIYIEDAVAARARQKVDTLTREALKEARICLAFFALKLGMCGNSLFLSQTRQ